MIDILHTAFSFIVIISLIVFIHEFGHYLIARLSGVKIEEFAIGFGKEIFGRNDSHGTRWKICLIPMGGYVKMFGDVSEASIPDSVALNKMTEEEKAVSFYHKPLYKKSAIVVAGPAFNLILTIIIFTYMMFVNGLATTSPIVGEVMQDSMAMKAGIMGGDKIISIDGKEIKYFNDIVRSVAINLGEPIKLILQRNNKKITINIIPKIANDKDALGNKIKRPILGIKSQKIKFEDVGLIQAVGLATKQTWDITMMSFSYLGQIIIGDRSAKELKGPLGIAKLSGQAADKGFITIIWFMAMLSANLGMVNLLPIPPLDGGHLMFYGLQAIRGGRPIAEKFQEYGYKTGFVFILSVMAFTVYNDIKEMFFG